MKWRIWKHKRRYHGTIRPVVHRDTAIRAVQLMMKSLKKGHTATKNQQQSGLDLFCTHNVFCAAGGNKINDRNLPKTSRNEYLVFLHVDFAMLRVT